MISCRMGARNEYATRFDIFYLQYLSLTTFFPRIVLPVRGINPFAFKLAVFVNPIDSPRFQRRRYILSSGVGL